MTITQSGNDWIVTPTNTTVDDLKDQIINENGLQGRASCDIRLTKGKTHLTPGTATMLDLGVRNKTVLRIEFN